MTHISLFELVMWIAGISCTNYEFVGSIRLSETIVKMCRTQAYNFRNALAPSSYKALTRRLTTMPRQSPWYLDTTGLHRGSCACLSIRHLAAFI